MKPENANSLRMSLLNDCRTIGDLRSRLIHDYPTVPDRNSFLQGASQLLVDLCSEMKASALADKQRSRLADQLYLLALELPPRVERLITAIEPVEEFRARKNLEEAWISLLDGLQKFEARAGPIELSIYFGKRANVTALPPEAIGPKVFLSYAHDDKKRVESLRRELIARGLDAWWDGQILPGEDWELMIKTAIEESVAFVVCFSKNVDAKNRSGIFPEVLQALEIYRQLRPGSIFLIPVRLDDCEVPRFKIDGVRDLAKLQYENLFPDDRKSEAIDRLVRAVQQAADKH
jgi:hypothetical protein